MIWRFKILTLIGINTILFILFLVPTVNAQSHSNQQTNIIIITLTSVQSDHLNTYGYRRITAPNIDRISKEGVTFDNAISQSYWTLPSEASIFTSKYVCGHGVYERNQRLSEKEQTLPEILKIYGYKTAAFVGGLDLIASYGVNQGFDYYYDDTKDMPMGSFKEIMPKALKWLRKNRDKKFFLFLQSYDSHFPYNCPKPYENMYDPDYNGMLNNLPIDYKLTKNIRNGKLFLEGKSIELTEKDVNHIIAHYDGCINYSDKFIGDLLNEIRDLNLSNNTMVIITSEHGEELLDHGSFDRFGQKNLYDEVVRVPLIIKFPNTTAMGGKRIIRQVQLIDIMPTILDFLGIPINKEAQGLSLVPLIEGKSVKDDFNRYAYSEASTNKYALRTNEYKLIYNNGKFELYDLKEDKMEMNDLSKQMPEIVYELTQRLAKWQRETKTTMNFKDTHIELTIEMKEKLKQAGYW